MRERER